jgi:kynurenine formamidase
MKATIQHKSHSYSIDLDCPIDISIPLCAGANNVNAWWAEPVKIEPVRMGDFVGDVNQGGSVNFRNVYLNPHGNGTHTECVGHISKEPFTINQSLKTFFFLAQLITIEPTVIENGDAVILKEQLQKLSLNADCDALIIRTLPNGIDKLTKQYSGTNFPYVDKEAMQFIVEQNIQHFLIDLPSVDRESDEGKLQAHHVFWKYPENTRTAATITEMIYVKDEITDGIYFLNLQITALENDASPSKPVLYKINAQ